MSKDCASTGAQGKAPLLKLNDGRNIPQLALGTFLGWDIVKNAPFVPKPKEVSNAVEWAIDAGYRHIDTAAVYGTEDQVGEGVNNKIKEGVVKREDVFVTTKVWDRSHEREQVVKSLRESLSHLKLDYVDLFLIHSPTGRTLWNDMHSRENVVKALRNSLANLHLEYVDLYLIHWPVTQGLTADGKVSLIDYLETWKGMEDAQKLGLTKSIGISNFNTSQIQRLWDNAEIKPAVLEVEVNPNLIQKKLLKFAKDKGIVVMSYSPFGSLIPSRSTKDSPPPKIDDPILTEIAKKYGKTTPQVVLRYLIDIGTIPIPKSINKNRIEQNIDIFDFKLTKEDVAKVESFNKNYRIVNPEFWKEHPYYPFVEFE